MQLNELKAGDELIWFRYAACRSYCHRIKCKVIGLGPKAAKVEFLERGETKWANVKPELLERDSVRL